MIVMAQLRDIVTEQLEALADMASPQQLGEVGEAILREAALVVDRALSKERATTRTEARQAELERITAIATATLKLGEAYAAIAKAGDNITTQLEPLLEDHNCQRCGQRAGKAGAFVLVAGAAKVACAACSTVRW